MRLIASMLGCFSILSVYLCLLISSLTYDTLTNQTENENKYSNAVTNRMNETKSHGVATIRDRRFCFIH